MRRYALYRVPVLVAIVTMRSNNSLRRKEKNKMYAHSMEFKCNFLNFFLFCFPPALTIKTTSLQRLKYEVCSEVVVGSVVKCGSIVSIKC